MARIESETSLERTVFFGDAVFAIAGILLGGLRWTFEHDGWKVPAALAPIAQIA